MSIKAAAGSPTRHEVRGDNRALSLEWQRRLPRSNAPLKDESLAGYLLNLSFRLDLSPHELLRRTGIKVEGRVALLDLSLATGMPDEVRGRFVAATGLSDREAQDLTTARFGDRLLAGGDENAVAKTKYGNRWLWPGRSRACPQCLAEPGPNAALWRVHWLTPWSVACTRHQCLLIDTCPSCSTPIGEPGTSGFRSLIPNVTVAGAHPAACRAVLDTETPRSRWSAWTCDMRLDAINSPTASADVVSLQDQMDQALRGDPGEQFSSLGAPTTHAQWLRDMRVVTILILTARQDWPLADLPHGLSAATLMHARQTSTGPKQGRSRLATQPPQDVEAMTGLLLAANKLLDQHTLEPLNVLARAAREREPAFWASLENNSLISDRLSEALRQQHKRLTQPFRLRAYTLEQPYTFTPANVAPYLDDDTFVRYFHDTLGCAGSRNSYERPLRRYVPIALVMLAADLDATSAGALLGYTKSTVDSSVARAGRTFVASGEPDLLDRIARIAQEIEAAPRIDWKRRRDWFADGWSLSDQDWSHLKTQCAHRRDTDWDSRRPVIETWIYSNVAGIDVKDALKLANSVGKVRAGTVKSLQRHGGRDLHRYVQQLSDQIAAVIDES